MRDYWTRPSTIYDSIHRDTFQPDAHHIKALHAMLDLLEEPIAMRIDHIVAELLAYRRPGQITDRIEITSHPELEEDAS